MDVTRKKVPKASLIKKSERSAADALNPLAVPYRDAAEINEDGRRLSCMHLSLQLEPKGNRLEGAVSVSNDCDHHMALLTSPLEVYSRIRKEDIFSNQTLVEPVFAILYIFKDDLGMGQDAFLTEGGREVFGWPKYTVVPRHSTTTLPILDRSGVLARLPNGTYGGRLITLVAPTTMMKGNMDYFNVNEGVNEFNDRNRSELIGARRGTRSISSAIASFRKE